MWIVTFLGRRLGFVRCIGLLSDGPVRSNTVIPAQLVNQDNSHSQDFFWAFAGLLDRS